VFRKDHAFRSVAIHPLEIPDGIVVFDPWPEYVTPAPSHTLRNQVVINFPVFANGFEVWAVAWIAIPRRIHREMDMIARGIVVSVIEIRNVVKLIGRDN